MIIINTHNPDGNKFIILMWPGFFKELLLCHVSYIELFTMKF